VTAPPNGSFLYTPNNGFTGGDSFTYRANDGLRTRMSRLFRSHVANNLPQVSIAATIANASEVVRPMARSRSRVVAATWPQR
jgi:hypothetical protein